MIVVLIKKTIFGLLIHFHDVCHILLVVNALPHFAKFVSASLVFESHTHQRQQILLRFQSAQISVEHTQMIGDAAAHQSPICPAERFLNSNLQFLDAVTITASGLGVLNTKDICTSRLMAGVPSSNRMKRSISKTGTSRFCKSTTVSFFNFAISS